MKKSISILLLTGFIFWHIPAWAGNTIQSQNKQELQNQKLEVKNIKKKKSSRKQIKDANSEKLTREVKKKEIEAKERSIDKNTKVKKVSVDENLPQTVRQRNIP